MQCYRAILASRSAFTLPELLLGLAITALVVTAVGALAHAMTNTWSATEASQSLPLSSHQVTLRLANTLHGCRWLGYVRAGSLEGTDRGAGLLYWRGDANNDGSAQMGELGWIVHDPVKRQIILYEPLERSRMDSSQRDVADRTIPVGWLTAGWFADSLLSLDDARLSLMAGKPLGSSVQGAVFSAGTPAGNDKPRVEMTLRFTRKPRAAGGNAHSCTQYATATLRQPGSAPK